MAAILVVDDDDTIRDTLYDLLSEEHRCHTAETAENALKLLDAEFYDVVLTDISMPGLSGLELLGHVRQRYPDTPVDRHFRKHQQGARQGNDQDGTFH